MKATFFESPDAAVLVITLNGRFRLLVTEEQFARHGDGQAWADQKLRNFKRYVRRYQRIEASNAR